VGKLLQVTSSWFAKTYVQLVRVAYLCSTTELLWSDCVLPHVNYPKRTANAVKELLVIWCPRDELAELILGFKFNDPGRRLSYVPCQSAYTLFVIVKFQLQSTSAEITRGLVAFMSGRME